MVTKRSRKKVRPATETDVLFRSRRRCAICFGLHRDTNIKKGQIAHLDKDPSNNDPDNLAFLCFDHHDTFDSTTRQSKNLTEGEVKLYRAELEDFFGDESFWPDSPQVEPVAPRWEEELGISPELYDRRIHVYRILKDFLITVISAADVEISDLKKFAQDTDEALFLFDTKVAQYLDEVYQRAVRLRAAGQRIQHREKVSDEDWRKAIEEDAEILNWFSAQFGESRSLFKPYLNIDRTPNPCLKLEPVDQATDFRSDE
jgi:hypothetical protein